MDGFYSPNQMPAQQMQQQLSQQQNQNSGQSPTTLNMAAPNNLNSRQGPPLSAGLVQDSSLISTSDILGGMIREKQTELHRRRSMSQAYVNPMAQDQTQASRRMSAMGVGDVMGFSANDNDLSRYQFNQAMNNSGFPAINTNLSMTNQMVNSATADPGEYSGIPQDMMGSMMASNFASMNFGGMGPQMGNPMGSNDPQAMNIFNSVGPSPMGSQFHPSQAPGMANNFSMDLNPEESPLNTTPPTAVPSTLPGADQRDEDMMSVQQSFNPLNGQNPMPTNLSLDPGMHNFNQNQNMPLISRHISNSTSVLSPPQGASYNASLSGMTQPSSTSEVETPSNAPTPRDSKDKTVYSKSGFDMLKALWLVATRKEARIHLGAVDMSCAFVVCDVTMNDCPIIYVSDNFQNLTGYSRHEIIGKNCRFLQSPTGKVEAGSKREFVDDGAVYHLKQMIQEGKEVQQSLINYRKGGKPFLNLLTMIPIPWDTEEIRYFIGFQIDVVECPDAIAQAPESGGVKVNYKHNDIGQYIWSPPSATIMEPENGQSLSIDDVSTLLQQWNPKGLASDWHKQSWDKMLLENADDVVHVLSLKGLFLYLSPACKRVLEYEAAELVGNSLSTVCHPSDIVPVTRELKDATAGTPVNIVFRIRRKDSGYTWFESHGSLFVEQGKGRKCIILVGRKRPVFALSRRNVETNGGIGDGEIWSKLSTSGMFLFVSTNIRSLLDLQAEELVGTSIQSLMRKESRPEFGRSIEKARNGKTVSCKHEVHNRRGQVLQAQTVLYPGDATEGQKPSFLLAQTRLVKASSRNIAPANAAGSGLSFSGTPRSDFLLQSVDHLSGQVSQPTGSALVPGTHDAALASDDNLFNELRTTKCSSWQFELRQMEKVNRILAEELGGLLSNKKKRKRRKGVGNLARDCANCHTRNTPEWRRGPSGQRDLCNSCGLRWAKQTGRVSPRNSSRGGNTVNGDAHTKKSNSPIHSSPLQRDFTAEKPASMPASKPATEEGSVNPAQLTNQASEDGASTLSGAPSATGVKPSAMPPPSSSAMMSGVPGGIMTAIREERESSQP